MFGLLGLGAGLLGFGKASSGMRKERDRQLGAIAEQDAVLDENLAAEQDDYRATLRSRRQNRGVGSFVNRLTAARQFTGF